MLQPGWGQLQSPTPLPPLLCSNLPTHPWPAAVLVQPQVENLTNKWHIHMTYDGRISMAGLSASKCRYLAEAIKDSVENC